MRFCIYIGWLCIVLSYSKTISAQEEINATDFFRNAMVSSLNSTLSSNPNNVKIPWVEQLDLRTETRDFLWREQEYTLRISPNMPRKRKAQQELLAAIQAQDSYGANEKLCQLSEQAHELWLKLYMIKEEKKGLQKLLALLQEEQKMLDIKLQNLKIEEGVVLDSYYKINDLKYQLFQIDEIEQLLLRKSGLDSSSVLNFDDMISVSAITQIVNQSSLENNSVMSGKIDSDIRVTEKELALEDAQRNHLFDFAQIRYRGPHDDFLNERFSIGLGFRMDRNGNDRIKKYELETKLDQLQLEKTEDQYTLDQTLDYLTSELRVDIKNYQFLQEQSDAESLKMNLVKQKVLANEEINLDVWLTMNLREQKMEARLLEAKYDIYQRYLEWLDESGAYCRSPYFIYLN